MPYKIINMRLRSTKNSVAQTWKRTTTLIQKLMCFFLLIVLRSFRVSAWAFTSSIPLTLNLLQIWVGNLCSSRQEWNWDFWKMLICFCFLSVVSGVALMELASCGILLRKIPFSTHPIQVRKLHLAHFLMYYFCIPAQCKNMMPRGNYRWNSTITVKQFLETPESSTIGYFVEMDLKYPQSVLESFWDIFEILKFFGFLLNFQQSWNLFVESPGCTGQSFFSVKKINQNLLKQCFLERFRTILKNSKFFQFFEVFSKSRRCRVYLPFFRKKYLKTSSEHVWTLLGNVLDTLEILKFPIFSSFLLPNLQGALSKNFTGKSTTKHVQNIFDCFWERFWAFWKIESFSSFLKFFRISTFQGIFGNFFPGKITSKQIQNMFAHF